MFRLCSSAQGQHRFVFGQNQRIRYLVGESFGDEGLLEFQGFGKRQKGNGK
jgi:hypothetical protein